MSIVIDSIGIFGSCCIALSLYPQTYKTIKTRSMKDIDIPFVLLTMLGASSQLLYGIYKKVIPMIIANVCVLLNTCVLLVFKIYLYMYIGKPDQVPVPMDALRNLANTLESSSDIVEINTRPIELSCK